MLADSPCPVARSADLLGDRWTLLVVRDAFDGQTRFSGFQRSLGVARNILADRLKRLVEAGVLELQPADDGSAYQQYTLTEAGQALFPVVVALRQWAERHRYAPQQAHSQLLDRHDQPVPYMQPVAADGSVLQPAHSHVRKLPDPH